MQTVILGRLREEWTRMFAPFQFRTSSLLAGGQAAEPLLELFGCLGARYGQLTNDGGPNSQQRTRPAPGFALHSRAAEFGAPGGDGATRRNGHPTTA
jgi:hypothetical protein